MAIAKKARRVGRGPSSYLHFDSLLSERQLAAARKFVTSAPVQSKLSSGFLFNEENRDQPNVERKQGHDRDRQSRIVWLERSADEDDAEAPPPLPGWLHGLLRKAAKVTHARFGDSVCPVGIDSNGRWTPRYEPVQYTEYGMGAHYAGWHTDAELDSDDVEDARAVTVVVLLSDTDAFEGGKFQARVGGARATSVPLRAGDAIAFPAKRLEHRVTKVTAGLRQSLVFWVTRPGA